MSQPRSARVTATTDGGSRETSTIFHLSKKRAAITAQVTGGAPGRFELSIQIDKGTRDGVQRDMAVVNEKGLVGRINLTASKPVFGRLVPRRGIECASSSRKRHDRVRRGPRSRPPLAAHDINGLVQVKKGDIVMTAGSPGSAFPGGIPVGHVHSVVNPTGTLPAGHSREARRRLSPTLVCEGLNACSAAVNDKLCPTFANWSALP